MNEWYALWSVWEYLTQDVAVIGGLQSPMLSWIGVIGILSLCCWHSVRLFQGVWRIRQAVSRIQSKISAILLARQQQSTEWCAVPGLMKKRARSEGSSEARRDLDDLQTLDHVMHSEKAFTAEWLSYRKTFVIEQPAWFLEPAVYSQKSAAEFFSFDALTTGYLNVGFYRQLPSFLTGMGLMFTFLAILIGLGKLHATGSQIEGIQGLINGLSGKFVTSIVGLACANAFTVLETSLWHCVANQHRTCISRLDEIFPQRTINQPSQVSAAPTNYPTTLGSPALHNTTSQLVEGMHQRLGAAVTALTKVSDSLTAISAAQGAQKGIDLPGEIGHEVQRAMKSVIHPLVEVIQDLTRTIKGQSFSTQLSKSDMEAMFQDLKTHRTATLKTPVHSTKEHDSNKLVS